MAFDFKKEYKEFYMPPKKPVIVNIPKMNYIAVRGKGNPNEENVVPPLEGFWWQDNIKGVDYSSKDTFNWISVIRLIMCTNHAHWAI